MDLEPIAATRVGRPARTPLSELLEVIERSRPAWHAEAACRDEDTAVFFRGDPLAAQWICTECPARLPCLRWAMEHAEAGVWGGTTEADRKAMGAVRAKAPRSCRVCGVDFTPAGPTSTLCGREECKTEAKRQAVARHRAGLAKPRRKVPA